MLSDPSAEQAQAATENFTLQEAAELELKDSMRNIEKPHHVQLSYFVLLSARMEAGSLLTPSMIFMFFSEK